MASHTNIHAGSKFDDFLKEEGIYEEVHARALKRALAEQLDDVTLVKSEHADGTTMKIRMNREPNRASG